MNIKEAGKIIAKAKATAGEVGIANDLQKATKFLSKSEKMAEWAGNAIFWWSIAETAYRVGKTVYENLQLKSQERCLSFTTEEGTREHQALLSMAAKYVDRNKQQCFILDKKAAFKPSGDFIMHICGKDVNVSKDDSSGGNPMTRTVWYARVPISITDQFIQIFEEFLSLDGEVELGTYRWTGWSWSRVGELCPRTVFLPTGTFEDLKKDVIKFLGAKKWFQEKEIPWKRGYLFYGLPGTGKTSTAMHLARSIGKSLYCLNSKSCSSTSSLEDAFRSLPSGAMVLIEDLDCIFDQVNASRDEENTPSDPDERPLTLSDFLNVIDGATSHTNGRILLVTTNHLDRLDKALIRPGRIDKRIFFTYADEDQRFQMACKMLGEEEGRDYFQKRLRSRYEVTMAEVENELLPVALEKLNEEKGI